MKKIQLTLQQMRAIIDNAENKQKYDCSLSDTVIITVINETDRHTGGDTINAELVSNYQDCNSKNIY